MPTLPHTLRIRRKREARSLRGPARFLGTAGLASGVLFTLLISFSTSGLALAAASLTEGLPPIESISQLLEPPGGLPLEPTRFYDRSGEHEILVLEVPGAEGKEYLPLNGAGQDKLAEELAQATLAAADPDFWEHSGFSTAWRILDQKPSLAQRLVADFLLWDEPPGLRRQLRERLLAAQLTARYGREKILEWYLNSADYGNYAFGADAAARAYLGKPASQLTLAEAALLAAVSEAPELNPWDAPQAAHERQVELLEEMARLGTIDQDQLQLAAQEEVDFSPPGDGPSILAPAFSALAFEQASTWIESGRLARGGFQVITTLDFDLQQQASCAAGAQVARLQGLTEETGESGKGFVCLAARLLPTQPSAARSDQRLIFADVAVLDPASGQVLAMAAGGEPGSTLGKTTGHHTGHPTGHPPGTLLTPFIYLTAFTWGWSPASLTWDIPSRLPEGMSSLRNPDGTFHGPQRLRMALANDYLVPAAQLLDEIGSSQVWQMAQQLGLANLGREEQPGRASSGEEGTWQNTFEGSEITVIEASQAFGVFANRGLLVGVPPGGISPDGASPLRPVAVLRIVDAGGNAWIDCAGDLLSCPVQARAVISTQLAYLITDALSDEPARWPSMGHPNPLEIGRPASAKIGRVSNGEGAWTVGFTPHLVAGVWLGSDQAGESVLPDAAASLWHAVMQYATRDRPASGWSLPPGVKRLAVCDPSGMLPTQYCPNVVEETFLNGTEPTHSDGLFRAYLVNRESGGLATVFTPAGLVEERVYMILPPEAAEWAQAAGLPSPPQEYDPIGTVQQGAGNARLLAPNMFASVRGKVHISGRAAIEAFEYYQLQVGPGLNPANWLQIGEDVDKPVTSGELGVWDTAGLNGLYTIQLLVVAGEQEVETAMVQVTVDNQPPKVSIRYPLDGQLLSIPGEDPLVLQAEASDELSLASVQFLVDGEEFALLNAPPFAFPWPASPGRHRLLVRAKDQAGNTAESEIEFVVERK